MSQPTESLPGLFDFRSEGFEILLNGRSIIDTEKGLSDSPLRNAAEVHAFVQGYGFDLDNPIERAEVFGNLQEAINFIRKYFLQPENPDGLKLEIPRKILEITDIVDLFLLASHSHPWQSQGSYDQTLQNWACSILKVVHTIAHMDKDLRSTYFLEIQKQILDRFYKVIHRDPEGALYLGEQGDDTLRVNLVAFEAKPKKPRESTLIKLLHKPENVAEDIFDRVGVRFITSTRLDAFRVIKFLKDRRVVVPANIKPSRSRNTLISLEDLRSAVRDEKENFTDARIEKTIDEMHSATKGSVNRHTSEFYRSIQFTGRQLVKLKNPVFDDVRELKALAKGGKLPDEAVRVVERIDMKYVQKESRFFYPFEVQIVDKRTSDENEKGKSAHSEYRKAQIQTALRRVMKGFLDDPRSR